MAIYPHIKPAPNRPELQGIYALEGRKLPQEIFNCWVQTDYFDTNQQYWIQKAIGGPLFRVRVDRFEATELPEDVRLMVLSRDLREYQQYRLYVGNNSISAVEVLQSETSHRRYKVTFSLS